MKTLLWLLAALALLINSAQATTMENLVRNISGSLIGILKDSPHYKIREKIKQLPTVSNNLVEPYEDENAPFNTAAFLRDLSRRGESFTKDLLANDRILHIYATRILVACIRDRNADAWKAISSTPEFFEKAFAEPLVSFKSFLKAEIEKEKNTRNLDLLNKMKKVFETLKEPKAPESDENNYLLALASVLNLKQLKAEATKLSKDVMSMVFANGDSLIHVAVKYNNNELLRDLLGLDVSWTFLNWRENVDPNIGTTAETFECFQGCTPLMLAAMLNRKQAFEVIRRHSGAYLTFTTSSGINVKGIISQMSEENQEIYNEYLKDMSETDKMIYSVWAASCHGDSLAEAILNNRSDACLEAFIWSDSIVVSPELISAVLFRNRLRILDILSLHTLEEVRTNHVKSIFEPLSMLPHQVQDKEAVGPTDPFLKMIKTQSSTEVDWNYSPTMQELMLTRRFSPKLSRYNLKPTIDASGEDFAKFIIQQSLACYDGEMLVELSKVARETLKNYCDPETNEPIAHILMRDFYPVTRDLETLKQLKDTIDWTVKFQVTARKSFYTETTDIFRSENMSKVYGWRTAKYNELNPQGSRPRFTVQLRKFVEIPSSGYQTIAYYIAGREDYSELIENFKSILDQNPEWTKIKNQIARECNETKSWWHYERYYWYIQPARYDAGDLADGCENYGYYFNTYLTVQHTELETEDAKKKFNISKLNIDNFVCYGPEQNSVFHIIVAPEAEFRDTGNFLVELIEFFTGKGFDVNHVSRKGQKFTYTDLNKKTSETTTKGMTALQIALARRKWALADALIKKGADIYKTPSKERSMVLIYLAYVHSEWRNQ